MTDILEIETPRARAPYRRLKVYKSPQDAREAAEFFHRVAKSQSEGTNVAGGFTVPEVVAAAVISYRDRVGVIRANANVVNMTSDSITLPRRSTGVTGAFIGENATLADTQEVVFDNVTLSAKKIMTLVRASSELELDAVGFADFITGELAYSLAFLEDDTVINGDGSAASGGISGLTTKILDKAAAKDAAAGNDTFLEITLADLATALAAVPDYAVGGAKWYCSHVAYASVFCRLAAGAGAIQIVDGTPHFWGLPVVRSSLFPTSTGDLSNLAMLFVGDMNLACLFGARRAINVARSTSRYIEFDQTIWRATERFDAVWELGTAATVGPMVALIGD